MDSQYVTLQKGRDIYFEHGNPDYVFKINYVLNTALIQCNVVALCLESLYPAHSDNFAC